MAKKDLNSKYVTILPNHPVRPSTVATGASLDDTVYSTLAPNDLKYNLKAYGATALSIAGVAAITILLLWSKSTEGIIKSIEMMTETSPWLTWGTFGFAILGAVLWLLSLVLSHRNYLVFNRKKGTVEIPLSNFSREKVTVPFRECEGRLLRITGRYGYTEHRLALACPTINKMAILYGPSPSADIALGYWSFIAQYMNENGILPDIPPLEAYLPRERGLGTWDEWKIISTHRDFVDPFDQWIRTQNSLRMRSLDL